MKHTHPDAYASEFKVLVDSGAFSPNEILMFPLSKSLGEQIKSLEHSIKEAPEWSRDDRLRAWFQASVAIGANPVEAIKSAKEGAPAGLRRLINLSAKGSLVWWRDQGVEPHIAVCGALQGGQTTLATLAFMEANTGMLEFLIEGSKLTHTDILWSQLWNKKRAERAHRLASVLMKQSEPSLLALRDLPLVKINKKNEDEIITLAQKLYEMGCLLHPQSSDPSPITRLMKNIHSPSIERVLDFYLSNGVEVRGHSGLEDGGTILDAAQQAWLRCSSRSQMRPALLACFIKLIKNSDANYASDFFTQDRLDQITSALETTKKEGAAGFNPHQWDYGSERAAIEEAVLNIRSKASLTAFTKRIRL